MSTALPESFPQHRSGLVQRSERIVFPKQSHGLQRKKGKHVNVKQKLMVAVSAATLTIGGLAAGLASTGGTAAAAVKSQATPPAAQAPSTPSTPSDNPTAETPGTETPETPGTEAPGAPEKAEPGEANLPGGGHADPAGNVDNQFDGVQ
jgi:hypothetical protein